MCYDDTSRDGLIRQVSQKLLRFPSGVRDTWLLNMLNTLGVPGAESLKSGLLNGHKELLANLISTKNLSVLDCMIRERAESLRQAHWILFTLRRPAMKNHWRDVLLDALSVDEIVKASATSPQVADWMAKIYVSNTVPNPIDLIPALTSRELKQIRRHVDRVAKQFVRRPITVGSQGISDVLSGTEESIVSDNRIDVGLVLSRLSKFEKKVLYFRYIESYSLAELANELNVSVTTAHRAVLSALSNAHKYHQEGNTDVGHNTASNVHGR